MRELPIVRIRDTDNRAPALEIVVLSSEAQIMARVLDEWRDDQSSAVSRSLPGSRAAIGLASPGRAFQGDANTPALVDAAATAIARGEFARESDLDSAKRIFDAIGTTVILDETLMDAVTGLSGSGPAYVFLILEALSDAGVKVGLSRRTAQLLAAQTVFGSAKLLIETNEHPGRLKDMVTSPGGTAITGLHTLEHGGVRTTLMNAVEAATRRSRELGEAMLKKQG